MDEAAKLRKEADAGFQFAKMLKENPREFYKIAMQLGHHPKDIQQIAEDYLYEQYKYETMPEEQKELLATKEENKRLKEAQDRFR